MAFVVVVWLTYGAADNNGVLGDINRRNAAAVAADLDSIANLPSQTFDEVAPEILAVVRNAKSMALALRAMDVLCAKSGSARAAEATGYLSDCVDGLSADADLHKHRLLEAIITADPRAWGAGFRGAPETLALFQKIALVTDQRLDLNLYGLVVDTLMQLAASDSQRRSLLLEIITRKSVAGSAAACRIAPLLDDGARQGLRDMASAQPYNQFAVEALAEAGDLPGLAIIQDQRTRASAVGWPMRTHIQFLDRCIGKINLQNPQDNIIAYLRSPTGDWLLHRWAVGKARDLGLDHQRTRGAILEWAATAGSADVAEIKDYAQSLGILEPGDLAAASRPSVARLFGHSPPQRRTGIVDVPDRRAKAERWRPTLANYDAFFSWYGAQDRQAWKALSEDERHRQMKVKLCQLNLLSPDACEGVASSQPAPP